MFKRAFFSLILFFMAGYSVVRAQSKQLKQRVFYFDENGLLGSTDVLDALVGDDKEDNSSVSQQNIVVHDGWFYHVYTVKRDGDRDVFLRASRDGINWKDFGQVNDDSLDSRQTQPSIAIYDNGGKPVILVAWSDLRSQNEQIRCAVSTDGGVSFSPSVAVSDSNVFDLYIRGTIATAGDGIFYIVFYRIINSQYGSDNHIWFSKSTDNGLTWTPETNLWLEMGNSYNYAPDLVTWQGNPLVINPLETADNLGHTYNPALISSADSGTTWTQPSSFFQYGDFWQTKQPSMAIDSNGTLFALWVRGQYAGDSTRIVFARSEDQGASWSEEIPVSDSVMLKENWTGQNFTPSVAVSAQSHVYATWKDARRNVSSENGDIYLSYSFNGGQNWSRDTLVNTLEDAQFYNPSVAVKSGNIDTVLVVWREERMATGISSASDGVPVRFRLEQNFPNPFNPSTIIRFYLSQSETVRIKVYDLTGRVVAVPVNGQLSSGNHEVTFDAGKLAGGVYFYSLEAGAFRQTRKMLLLR
ncbi:MAG: T9SS C-terminal target domain-containing protein [Calditrichaeota bacterium]|nr:MAG: T9SS C-terminal target domain-containing protein [Calditrichota bacterium]